MLPTPTSLLPDQWNLASFPAAEPSNEFLAFGSSFAQGDQASQLWKSLTCAKTSGAGAANVTDRSTRKSAGCIATTPANTTTATTSTTRIFLNIWFSPNSRGVAEQLRHFRCTARIEIRRRFQKSGSATSLPARVPRALQT